MNVDKIVRSVKSKFIILICLAIMFITLISNLNHAFENLLVHDQERTVELVRDDSKINAAGYDDLLELKKSSWFDKVTGYGETIASVSNKFGVHAADIKVVMTDTEYSSIYKIDMLSGNFPDSRAMDRGESHAVVSGKLARKLFKTLDVVGNEIELNEKKYIVTGVYKDKGSSLWDMFGDGFDRIYIPYSSADGFEEKPVDVISLLIKAELGMDVTERFLGNELGNLLFSYKIIEYPVSGSVFHQFYDLFIFIPGALAILNTLIFIARFLLAAGNRLKKKAEILYFKDIIKTDLKSLICYLAVIVFCGIVTVLLLRSLQIRFIIADKYVPYDNIFDLQFYLDAFLGDIRAANSSTGDVYSIVKLYYDNMTGVNVVCAIAAVILITAATAFFNMLLISDATFLKVVRCLLITAAAGAASGIILSIFAGIEVFIPISTWMVFLYYFIISGANKKPFIHMALSNQ